MDKIDIKDFIYMEQMPEGDPDFSAEHNEQVIASVIKQTDANMRRKKREYQEALKERTSATAKYLMSLDKGSQASGLKYFGRRELARLRGEEILEKLKNQ